MKELKSRIVRIIGPNTKCLDFHVNTRISICHQETYNLPLSGSVEQRIKDVGHKGASIIDKINNILGCNRVSITQYSITVNVGEAFNPDDDGITDEVLDILVDCFDDKRNEVKIVTKDTRRDSKSQDSFLEVFEDILDDAAIAILKKYRENKDLSDADDGFPEPHISGE